MGAFSYSVSPGSSLVLPVPGRRVPAVAIASLLTSPSACWSSPPNLMPPPAHGLAAWLRYGQMCAVCCRRRGACGRTDRALGWLAIGRRWPRVHAWISLTSLASARSRLLPYWVHHLHNAGYMAPVCGLLSSLPNYHSNVKPFLSWGWIIECASLG
jgi:hypothetical protein